MKCTGKDNCQAEWHTPGCAKLLELRRAYRRGNDDALSLRNPEPGSPEYDYMTRYDSPDNQRDSMG